MTAETVAELAALNRLLQQLHSHILDIERQSNPGVAGAALLDRLLNDPGWAWLRALSSLMAEIDHVLAQRDAPSQADRAVAAAHIRGLLFGQGDLSNEQCAQNAKEMTAFIDEVVLRPGTKFRGVIFDVRRGPTVFGPKTRETLTGLVNRSAALKIKVAIICGESATQVLQFRSLCTDSPNLAQVFDNEPVALQWLRSAPAPIRR